MRICEGAFGKTTSGNRMSWSITQVTADAEKYLCKTDPPARVANCQTVGLTLSFKVRRPEPCCRHAHIARSQSLDSTEHLSQDQNVCWMCLVVDYLSRRNILDEV